MTTHIRRILLAIVIIAVAALPAIADDGYVLAGSVKWDEGTAASDIGVSVFVDGRELANAATDTNGNFSVRVHGPRKSAVLVATSFHFEFGVMLVDAVAKTLITEPQPVSLTLIRNGPASIKGRVLVDGTAMHSAQVEVRNKEWNLIVVRRTLSGPNGTFSLSGLPLGDYELHAKKNGDSWVNAVTLTQAAPVLQKEIELK
jgi:hypothetical protein